MSKRRKPIVVAEEVLTTVGAYVSPLLSKREDYEGWLCRGCDTYYAPFVRSCDCLKRDLDDE